jgi:hypothetical protein
MMSACGEVVRRDDDGKMLWHGFLSTGIIEEASFWPSHQ